jgi:multicomponent Na+:H+ antiporter subunit D
MTFEAFLAGLPPAVVHHAPVLAAAVPLLAAPLTALSWRGRFAWAVASTGAFSAAFFAIVTLLRVLTEGTVSYAVGGWGPPIGIELRVDALGGTMAVLVAVMGSLLIFGGYASVAAEVRKEKTSLFLAAFLLCFTGLIGICITGDAFNLFVFLEVNAIGTYAIVAMGASRDRRALPAAFNYLIMGSIGATFYVLGVGYIYAATGTLNMADMARLASPLVADSTVVQAGFALMVVGLGVKAAMFPLHQWLPGAYQFAPSLVSTFLAATATKVAIYAILRVTYTLFNPSVAFDALILQWVLAPLGALAVIACSVQALFQKDIKRILAYSSVAQIGYMLIGVALTTQAGAAAAVLHMLNHAFMKAALFLALAVLVLRYRTTSLDSLAGAARTAPWTVAAFAIGGLSLIGIPLTAGFISKWALLEAVLASGWLWAVIVISVGSLLAVLYVGRVLDVMYFKPPPADRAPVQEAPPVLLLTLWVLALANLWFGVDASLTRGLADAAAQAITDLANTGLGSVQ